MKTSGSTEEKNTTNVLNGKSFIKGPTFIPLVPFLLLSQLPCALGCSLLRQQMTEMEGRLQGNEETREGGTTSLVPPLRAQKETVGSAGSVRTLSPAQEILYFLIFIFLLDHHR